MIAVRPPDYFIRAILIALFLLGGAALSSAMQPTRFMAREQAKVDYAKVIPRQFEDWREDTTIAFSVVNPQQKALLDTLYSQQVSRVYVNRDGQRIMLSVAYGGDQSRDTQVHKPEVCYPAQGFALLSKEKSYAVTEFGRIPTMRLVAKQGDRTEPVTYWIRSGDFLVRGSIEQNLTRLRYGLRGINPDGLLFRVSSIGLDIPAQFSLQESFIEALLRAAAPTDRKKLIGESTVARD